MRFNIDDYKGKYVMHCKTEEEAKDFCMYLHNIGKKWRVGNSYSEETYYVQHREHTAYNFNDGGYCNVRDYRHWGYTILEWSDFMNKEFTKADLRTGDVILRRNGDVEIVNRELDMLICSNGGWNDLDDILEDLTYRSRICGDKLDIIEVRRPQVKSQCCFSALKSAKHYGTLVYERKEVEEMTLAEVCKLLGKEIKIVK